MRQKSRGIGLRVGKVENDRIYKIIVVGDPHVGKTELLTRFASDKFDEKYLPTVGVSIFKTAIELRKFKVTVNLMFWSIAGQPQFYMLHRPYFNGADGMLLVFDTTRSSTFSNINNWYSSAVKYGLSGIPRILVGNKIDLKDERKIILPMAEHLSEKLNAPYFETSALTGENIKDVFQKIAELIYRAQESDETIRREEEQNSSYRLRFEELVERKKLEYGKRILNDAIERLTNITSRLLDFPLLSDTLNINLENKEEEGRINDFKNLEKLDRNLTRLENLISNKTPEENNKSSGYCRYCGGEVEDNQIYCRDCGTRIN